MCKQNQIMGHENAAVIQRHYLNQTVKVDTQNTYLGSTNFATSSKRWDWWALEETHGPRAPTKSDGRCKDSENPKSRELLGLKEILHNELK